MEIEGYENYLIYEDGRVYSKKNSRFIKNRNNTNGYLITDLSKNSKKKTFYIHRLIALHYVDNPDPDKYNVVDHLDRNRLNNNITNLRWVNHTINMANQPIHKNNKLGEQYIVYKYGSYTNPYIFQITRNKILHRKFFKTLEEAKNYRDNFLLLQQQEQ